MVWIKQNLVICSLALGCFVLSSCEKYYVAVNQQWVDVRYLASTHVRTPDPRQNHPPVGQMMIVDWRIPKSVIGKKPSIQLTMIFWDYTEKTVYFPIDDKMGWVTYKLLDEEYDKTGGILTYKAEIVTEEGTIFREWKHQLWVNLITLDQEPELPAYEEEGDEDKAT